MLRPSILTFALLFSAATGCSDRLSGPNADARQPTTQPSLAKSLGDTNPRANLVWADSVLVAGVNVPAGIRGDGRLRDGAVAIGVPTNEYQGAWCGVGAFRKAPDDLNFSPNANWTPSMQAACGPARSFAFYLGGPSAPPTMVNPVSFARGLWTLALGQSVLQWEGFGDQIGACDKIIFNDSSRYAPANSPRQTRLPNIIVGGVSQRQWRIESQGSHMAACVLYNHNGSVKSVGPWYYLPFSLTVTEVNYPWSTFP